MILSVIIPCYNHGQYLQEAIDSVLSYHDQEVEIIIVDDGSKDHFTINKIEELKQLNFNVIQHENSGLAFSRNAGIAAAKGKYILPLDADNKIKADYIKQALPLLENDYCDIVYGKPSFFGENIEARKFVAKKFKGDDMIFGNFIDACAIYKREVWSRIKGYDINMPYPGLEDWEFWLNSYFHGFRFHFIDNELYDYRILSNSMIFKTLQENRYEECHRYIFNKHFKNIREQLIVINQQSQFHLNDQNRPFRSIFKYLKKWLGSAGKNL